MFVMTNLVLWMTIFTGQIERSGTDLLGRPIVQPETPGAAEGVKPRKIYFSDLQFVVETEPDGLCADSNRITEKQVAEPKVELNSDNRVVRKAGKNSVQFYALNVVFQKIGFDNAHYQFSVLDGVVPDNAPHGMRIRRQQGNFIYIYYLDQTFKLQLSQAPVYSFTALEKRGSCTIKHSVNLFADRSGYYFPAD